MPNSEARMNFVFDPFSDLVPPDIFLEITECLNDLSALLLSEGTLGSAIKRKSSSWNLSIL